MKQLLAIMAFLSGLQMAACQNNSKAPATAEPPAGKTVSVKKPSGKMFYKVNGEQVQADEKRVQCVFTGTGKMAQATIVGFSSSGDELSFVFFGEPVTGPLPEKKGSVNGGFRLVRNGVEYTNILGSGSMHITLTRTKTEGNSTYVAGTFEGKLKNKATGAEVTITEGRFESAHL